MDSERDYTTTNNFVVRTYGRTELAMLYYPNVNPTTAWRKLKNDIDRYPNLNARLAAIGYTPKSHNFTSSQVRLIARCLGNP